MYSTDDANSPSAGTTAVSTPSASSPKTFAAAPDGQRQIIPIGSLALESGQVLPDVEVAIERWGQPNADLSNVIVVLHALTGDSHVIGQATADQPSPGWWDGLFGRGRAVDTDQWCVIAPNVLGGCRGTTGPSSVSPDGHAWGSRFPRITVRDQVSAEISLMDRLGITRPAAVLGGSMGGARALEWCVGYPQRVTAALILAVGARATADQIGTQSTQIAAIESDPHWHGGDYARYGVTPSSGLGIARQIAHLTYRTESELDRRFANTPQNDEIPRSGGRYAVTSYLQHQASKLVARFDAGSYVALSDALNHHDVGRGRGGIAAALQQCPVPVIVGGIDSDRLYPLHLQREIADLMPGCEGLHIVESHDGHDGFLTEFESVGKLLQLTLDLATSAPSGHGCK